MRGLKGLVVALCLSGLVPAGAQQQQTEKITVRYADSPAIARQLKSQFPRYARDIFDLNADNSLILLSTSPQEKEELKKAISALDVPVKEITLEMRVLRFSYDGAGNWDVETVGQPTVLTQDMGHAEFSSTGDENGYSVELTPHINTDGSVRLDAGLFHLDASKAVLAGAKAQRTLHNNQKAMLLGLTSSLDPKVQEAVHSGHLSTSNEKRVDYFLQITPKFKATSK